MANDHPHTRTAQPGKNLISVDELLRLATEAEELHRKGKLIEAGSMAELIRNTGEESD